MLLLLFTVSNCRTEKALPNVLTVLDTSRQFKKKNFNTFLWIEKQRRQEHELEHLNSFGTEIMMRGHIVRQLCDQRNRNIIDP